MWPWTAATAGTVYLFHFHRPLGNLANARAQALHYVGFAEDFERRLTAQLAGRGAKLVAAALAQGIGYDLFHWPAQLAVEKLIKRTKKTALYCPTCCHAAGRPVRPLPTPATQLALPLDLDDFPAAPAARMDWYEIAQLRRWRATAATLITPADLARDAAALEMAQLAEYAAGDGAAGRVRQGVERRAACRLVRPAGRCEAVGYVLRRRARRDLELGIRQCRRPFHSPPAPSVALTRNAMPLYTTNPPLTEDGRR